MGWIKRNLVFVIIGVAALIALGGAGFYIYQGWSLNSDKSSKLNELYDTLQKLAQEQPQPGNEKHDNLKVAKEQEQQLRTWIGTAAGRFQPISPIPKGQVTSKTYATALNGTIYQLQQEAKDNSVGLPSQYYFSFQVQSSKLTISSGLDPLAQQLGEVKAIAEIFFAARVNNLDGIQRVPVSDDDVSGGLQSDYIDDRPVTNDLAILTPYIVTFRGFTPELAKVISGFATSTNPFIVKSVSVQPANAADNTGMGTPYNPQPPPGQPYPQQQYNRYDRYGALYGGYPGGVFPGQPMPNAPVPNAPVPGKGGLQTVLKEQLLRINLEVEVVKLLPKS